MAEPIYIAGNTLDLVIHDRDKKRIDNLSSFPIHSNITDHALVTFNYHFPTVNKVAFKVIKFRNYKKVNLVKLTSDIQSNLEYISINTCTNSLVNNLNNMLSTLHDSHFPIVLKSE